MQHGIGCGGCGRWNWVADDVSGDIKRAAAAPVSFIHRLHKAEEPSGTEQSFAHNKMNKMCLAHIGVFLLALHLLTSQVRFFLHFVFCFPLQQFLNLSFYEFTRFGVAKYKQNVFSVRCLNFKVAVCSFWVSQGHVILRRNSLWI